MTRCLSTALTVAMASTFALPPAVQAQMPREFPTTSLRGELMMTQPPDVTINGKPARLAPGARIKAQDNTLVMWGAAIGQKLVVNYTIEQNYNLVMDVWVLRDEERAKLWPKTTEQAAKWAFDPISKTWTKR